MAGRAELHRDFAVQFHAGKRLRPATEAHVTDAEAALGVVWPESYRQFALAYGAVYSPAILRLVVDHKSDFSDVQQFLTPKQSVTETRRWRLEPQGGCVAIASDCSGSFFAFRHLPEAAPRPDDAAVWLYDYEAGTVEMEAASFDEWLGRFLAIQNPRV